MADWIRIVPVVAAVFMADAVQMLARRPAHHSTCSPLAAFSKITTAPSSGLPAFIEHALTVTAQPKTTSCAQKNQMVYLLIRRVAAWQSVMLLSDSFFVVVVVDTAATGPLLFRHHSNWRRREKKPLAAHKHIAFRGTDTPNYWGGLKRENRSLADENDRFIIYSTPRS